MTAGSSRSSAATTRRPSLRLIELDDEKVKGWLGKGAQPTEAVARLIKVKGIS